MRTIDRPTSFYSYGMRAIWRPRKRWYVGSKSSRCQLMRWVGTIPTLYFINLPFFEEHCLGARSIGPVSLAICVKSVRFDSCIPCWYTFSCSCRSPALCSVSALARFRYSSRHLLYRSRTHFLWSDVAKSIYHNITVEKLSLLHTLREAEVRRANENLQWLQHLSVS